MAGGCGYRRWSLPRYQCLRQECLRPSRLPLHAPTRWQSHNLPRSLPERIRRHRWRLPLHPCRKIRVLPAAPARQAELMHVKREIPSNDNLYPTVCYSDLVPKLDGRYLFRDYETTLDYIREADGNTSRSDAPLYALWILSEKVEDLIGIIERHLSDAGCAPPMPPSPAVSTNFPLSEPP